MSSRGEMVLRRRAYDEALELRVNGVFVMDTAETSAERKLAELALARWKGGGGCSLSRTTRILVGGLGLGFTLGEVLRHSAASEVVVAEIEPDLVRWHRGGLIPHTSGWLTDERVQVVVADVAEVVKGQAAASVDVLLLDVDNGPGNLVYDANATLYRSAFLRSCRAAMSSGGVTAFWSADPAPGLRAELSAAVEAVEEITVAVQLGQRESTYTLLLGTAVDVRQDEAARKPSDTVKL